MSIARLVDQVALREDFVSFKLDIDLPEVELPIAFEFTKDAIFSKLVDEFFFELHFRCEFLMYCGWTPGVPKEVDGFKLTRSNMMGYFLELRQKGIRSHIWP
jgi:hypothetical protein